MSIGKIVGNRERYRIEDSVAKGAFSVVYRCVEVGSKRQYAIKVINKKLAERQHMTEALIREVNAMEVASGSPYVVRLVDKLVSKHNYYIIMNLAEGGTLLDMIRERRRANDFTWIAPFFKQLLMGIASMHESNVVHRDIKPENILLNKRKTRLLISDFGFACYAPPQHTLHRACGTLRYCAPELLVESPSYDGRRVDIWAAGVTLYVMFCGAHPFPTRAGVDPDTLLDIIRTTSISFPPHIPVAARDMIEKMLALDPAERWQAKDLIEHEWLQHVSARLPGDEEVDGGSLSATRRSTNRSYSNIALLAATSAGRPQDELGGHTPPSLQILEYADDGFYNHSTSFSPAEAYHNSDGCADSSDSSGSHDGLANAGPPGAFPGSGGDATFGNSSAFSSQFSSRTGSGASPHVPSSMGVSVPQHPMSHTRPSLEDTDYDVVLEGLFIRPRAYLHGAVLTAKVVGSFVCFCLVLVVAVALRALFNTDMSKLPVPRFVQEVFEEVLSAPEERRAQRQARLVARARHTDPSVHPGPTACHPAPDTGAERRNGGPWPPVPHSEGLLGSRRLGRGARGSLVPGSKLRQYVRSAVEAISRFSMPFIFSPGNSREPSVDGTGAGARAVSGAGALPTALPSFMSSQRQAAGLAQDGSAALASASSESTAAGTAGLRRRRDVRGSGADRVGPSSPSRSIPARGVPTLPPAGAGASTSTTRSPTPPRNLAATASLPPAIEGPRRRQASLPSLLQDALPSGGAPGPAQEAGDGSGLGVGHLGAPRPAQGESASEPPSEGGVGVRAVPSVAGETEGSERGEAVYSPSVPLRNWPSYSGSAEDFPCAPERGES